MANVYLLYGDAETALGSLGGTLCDALSAGASKSGPIDRYDSSQLSFRTAACVDRLFAERREGENLTQALLRRILPVFAGFPAVDTIIWAGAKGNAEFIEQEACSPGTASSWPYLPRHYSLWLRQALGYPDHGIELMEVGAACASSTLAIALGADLIASGRSGSVLVVAADIVSRFTLTGFNSLLALSNSVCRPFDIDRNGLLLGDGAVCLLLAGAGYVKEAGLAPMARLSGWGAANDATHISAPARDGSGLIAAITAAMNKAKVLPAAIGAFCTHGTGTMYNDAMELTATDAIFGNRLFPLFSIKGALGHTLGAAGGIEVLVCARALADAVVPPTAGLRHAETRAQGRVSCDRQALATKRILTSNSGFGGINAALILENA
jgi:3-oxoacyl-[acyl-carrier-protein] synthase II